MEEEGIKREEYKLRVGIFGAEPWTEGMRKEIEERWNIKAIDIFGLSEVIGPGVSCECIYQDGLHVQEDHFIPEIIDPVSLEVLSGEAEGELVFTTVTKEGLPLVRYRTRDLTTLNYEPCKCGRTLVRMKKCTGRSDDMLIIRVVNLFPSQIESLNISFFLSFFGKSVRTLGKEKFLEKYQFECSDEVKATFISFVDTALKNNSSPIV